jgi:PTH1 family peptidyl-tRNA hydrolase
MILIIGLGNPGKKYELTRHNFGKMAIRQFAKSFNFPAFKLNKELKSEISKNIINNQELVLAIPATYMNESGQAIKLLTNHYQVPVTNLWVIHDDIDLPLDSIRISQNRSAAGHKGVQSIIDQLKTQNFTRFRLGIKPRTKTDTARTYTDKVRAEKFVLQKFARNEQKTVQGVIKLTVEAIKFTLENGTEKTMEHYN